MSNSESIPIRSAEAKDPALPLGETPGGSVYATTPGGTRIFYDRAFLLSRRESPIARSPPVNLPFIPEVTLVAKASQEGGDDPFSMDL